MREERGRKKKLTDPEGCFVVVAWLFCNGWGEVEK